MPLKIVSGNLKGRILRSPKSLSIRPAAAKVRTSVFEILGDLTQQQVLDLFAGTGSMGLEALSRGAQHAVFVDSGAAAIALLNKNLQTTRMRPHAHLLKKPALHAIEWLFKKHLTFDLIFLDPPYDRGLIDACLKKLSLYPLLNKRGRLVCEHSPREHPSFLSGLRIADQRKYGQTWVTFFEAEHER